MNESDLRAELQRLATGSPAAPARLDIDEMLRHGRQGIRRRRAGAFQASVAAAALVVLSSVGIVRLTSEQFGGPSQPGTPAAEIPEAGGITNPVAAPWEVPTYDPVPPRGARFLVPAAGTRPAMQATVVQSHVAF
jgi:hypothetical protein